MAGLFGRIPSEGRWLWIGGLAADVSNAQLTERIGTHQAREGSGSTYELHRRDGGAWVHFARPSLAQMCLTALNGTNLTGAQGGASTLRVRYAADREDTSAAPAVLYLKRPLPTAAGIAAEEATAKKAHTSSSNGRPDAPAAKRAKNDESAGRASQQKAQPASAHSASPATVCAGTKSEAGVLKGATSSGRTGAAASSADATNGLVTTSAAAGRSDGSANLGANGVDGRSILGAHTKTMGPGALADMLRIALQCALAFLTHHLRKAHAQLAHIARRAGGSPSESSCQRGLPYAHFLLCSQPT